MHHKNRELDHRPDGRMPSRSTPRLLLASAAAMLCLALGAPVARTDIPPETLAAAEPGTVFKSWPIETGLPAGYRGDRILYRSTDQNDAPVAVTGVVLYPAAPTDKPRDVVAWAHPTTGVTYGCAPSLLPDVVSTIMGVDHLAAGNYVVVATDYIGLGNDGTHPYLIGKSEASTVLDSVRAARRMQETHAGTRFAVWGHSQGGHATLFTGETAASYAPELEIVGVAAAAPVTDIAAMYRADAQRQSGRALISMIIVSWSRIFGPPLDEIVKPDLQSRFETFAGDCIETVADFDKFEHDDEALPRDFLKVDPLTYAPLRTRMNRNTPGLLPAGLPVFLAQGTADEVVPPPVTMAHMKRLCDAGSAVALKMIPNGVHAFAARDSAEAAVKWMTERFRGAAPPSDC